MPGIQYNRLVSNVDDRAFVFVSDLLALNFKL